MFILTIKSAVIGNFLSWDKAKQFMSSSIGQDLIGGVLAKPVFINVRKHEEEKLKAGAHNPNKEENPFVKAFKWLKENFAYGDLFAGCGLGFMLFNHKFLASSENGFFGRSLNWAAGIFSGACFVLGRVGQALNLHKEYVYGPEMCEVLIREYENENPTEKCFIQLDNADLVRHADKQTLILAYNQDQSSEITERHTLKQIGGLFSGIVGTGKSEGARLVLGNFVKEMKTKGKGVEIFQLNLGNFMKALERYERMQRKGKEALGLIDGELQDINIGGNKTLIAFQYLIKRCKESIQKAKENGNESAIFIDEWEKVLNAKNLKGCDEEEVSRLITEWNYLLEDNYGNILTTSNKTCGELDEELRNILPDKARAALIRRFREVVIELPNFDTQARIISNYIDNSVRENELSYSNDFSFKIDDKDLSISSMKEFKTALLLHSSTNGNYLANEILTPNDIRLIIEGLPGYLRDQKRITGDSSRRITLDDIKLKIEKVVSGKVELNSQKNLRQAAYSTIQHYIQTNKDTLIKSTSEEQQTNGLGLFKSIYKCERGIFYSSDDNHAIQFLGTGKVLVMLKKDGNEEDFDKVEIDGKEFEQMVNTELFNISPKKPGLNPEELLSAFFSILGAGGKLGL